LKKFYERWNRRVQVIWNVPSKLDDPDPKEVEAVKSAYSGRKTIAFVGGLMREKGLRVAIEAAAKVKPRHPEALFLFIGPMKDDRCQVEELISKKCVGDQIKILSSMPYRKMMAHLVHAEIGLALHQQQRIYPFVSTGNGRKFFTYMQAGLAIVGPQFSEVGKAVELADCGMLVDTEDAGAVSEAILDLLDAPEKLKRYKQNARSAFETRYNWEREEPKFLRFLEKVVG
jgi:glycosyltransferase involved in cell wall biosynthesis